MALGVERVVADDGMVVRVAVDPGHAVARLDREVVRHELVGSRDHDLVS